VVVMVGVIVMQRSISMIPIIKLRHDDEDGVSKLLVQEDCQVLVWESISELENKLRNKSHERLSCLSVC